MFKDRKGKPREKGGNQGNRACGRKGVKERRCGRKNEGTCKEGREGGTEGEKEERKEDERMGRCEARV